jgi:hypothetical protein
MRQRDTTIFNRTEQTNHVFRANIGGALWDLSIRPSVFMLQASSASDYAQSYGAAGTVFVKRKENYVIAKSLFAA